MLITFSSDQWWISTGWDAVLGFENGLGVCGDGVLFGLLESCDDVSSIPGFSILLGCVFVCVCVCLFEAHCMRDTLTIAHTPLQHHPSHSFSRTHTHAHTQILRATIETATVAPAHAKLSHRGRALGALNRHPTHARACAAARIRKARVRSRGAARRQCMKPLRDVCTL